MLKRWMSAAAHDVLRRSAHRSVDAMDAPQVREALHRASALAGRLFTLAAGERAQRDLLHTGLDGLSHAELRKAAENRLPRIFGSLLAWLDR